MRHRHLAVEPATPVTELGAAALDDLLDRGDLEDWQPILREIRRDPWGAVAVRAWIEAQRAASPRFHAGKALRKLRLQRGRTQRDVAERLGMTQPEVSKLERRADVRVSTMRAYVTALGGELRLTARFADAEVQLD